MTRPSTPGLFDAGDLDADYSAPGASENERARQRMAARRAAERDIELPPVADPARRASCEYDLRAFLETYLSPLFFLGWSETHLRVIANLEQTVLHGGKEAIAIPRGSGKTTLCSCAILWALLYGHLRYCVLICATSEDAKARLREMQEILENTGGGYDALTADFPEACIPPQALEGAAQKAKLQTVGGERTRLIWGADEVRLAQIEGAACSGAWIKTRGSDGAIRGLKDKERRPDLVLIDDAQTDESAISKTQTDKRESYIDHAVSGLVGPGQSLSIFSIWTIIAKGDLADRFTSSLRPAFRSTREAAVRALPEDRTRIEHYISLRRECQLAGDIEGRGAHAWYLEHREEIERGVELLWEENRDGSDVGDRAMSEAYRTESFVRLTAAGGWEAALRTKQISGFQRILDHIADWGWSSFFCEMQNAPPDPMAGGVPQLSTPELTKRLSGVAMGGVPAEATELVGMIDVGSRTGSDLHAMVCGVSAGLGGAIVWSERMHVGELASEVLGDEEAEIYAAVQAAADRLCARSWTREDGTSMRVGLLVVDANWQTRTVVRACRESAHAGVLQPGMGRPVKPGQDLYKTVPKGATAGDGWLLKSTAASGGARMLQYDANRRKTVAAERLLCAAGGSGAVMLPGTSSDAVRLLADQLSSERRQRLVTSDGRETDLWIQTPGAENHLWDCFVGCMTAASVRGLDAPLQPARIKTKPRRKRGRAKTYDV